MRARTTHVRLQGVTLAYGDFVIQQELTFTIQRGDVFINAVNWDSRVMVNRPRTVGVSYRRHF